MYRQRSCFSAYAIPAEEIPFVPVTITIILLIFVFVFTAIAFTITLWTSVLSRPLEAGEMIFFSSSIINKTIPGQPLENGEMAITRSSTTSK